MVKYQLKVGASGQLYLPKEIREELGNDLQFLADMNTAVLFRSGVRLKDVLRSLEIIIADLLLRAEAEDSEFPA